MRHAEAFRRSELWFFKEAGFYGEEMIENVNFYLTSGRKWRLKYMIVRMWKNEPTWEQTGEKECLIPKETQSFQNFHTQNPQSERVRYFFSNPLSGGESDQMFIQ